MPPADAARGGLPARLLADGLVVLALGAWWLTSLGLPALVLPSPWAVGTRLARLFLDPAFLGHTLASAARVVLSVGLAAAIGLALALLAERVPALADAVHRRLLPALNSFPSVGWAILAVIWFQVSTLSVVFVQVMILIPFCLINMAQGLQELDRELLEMGRSFGRARVRLLVRVVIPLLMPYTLAAVRIAYGIGWKIALVSELFGADSGLGYLMLRAQTVSDAAMVFATCFAIVVMFTLGERLVIEPLASRVPAH